MFAEVMVLPESALIAGAEHAGLHQERPPGLQFRLSSRRLPGDGLPQRREPHPLPEKPRRREQRLAARHP